jgi:hypothetical protein
MANDRQHRAGVAARPRPTRRSRPRHGSSPIATRMGGVGRSPRGFCARNFRDAVCAGVDPPLFASCPRRSRSVERYVSAASSSAFRLSARGTASGRRAQRVTTNRAPRTRQEHAVVPFVPTLHEVRRQGAARTCAAPPATTIFRRGPSSAAPYAMRSRRRVHEPSSVADSEQQVASPRPFGTAQLLAASLRQNAASCAGVRRRGDGSGESKGG